MFLSRRKPLHTRSSDDKGYKLTRTLGVDLLLAYINNNSAGRTVIIAGDLSDRWYTSDLSIDKYILSGFNDVRAAVIKGGVLPTPGSTAKYCSIPAPINVCDVVDMIMFRLGSSVKLSATSFNYKSGACKQPNGKIFSDLNPVLAEFLRSV